MATPPPVYDRAPSEELKKLLLPSGFLSPLVELAGKRLVDTITMFISAPTMKWMSIVEEQLWFTSRTLVLVK